MKDTQDKSFIPLSQHTRQRNNILTHFGKLWLEYTDLSNSPCAFSEAPAEGIFSIYERVSTGRETLTNIVGLTRVAAHGPPCGTQAAAELSKQALSHYKSKYGERFCTQFWKPGLTSNTLSKLKAKKWDW